jgi:hypothetical protein
MPIILSANAIASGTFSVIVLSPGFLQIKIQALFKALNHSVVMASNEKFLVAQVSLFVRVRILTSPGSYELVYLFNPNKAKMYRIFNKAKKYFKKYVKK